MSGSTITLKTKIINDEYTQHVYDKFDIQDSEKTEVKVHFDLTPIKGIDWNIGVIYGSSGCGKTTILKALGELKDDEFDHEKALISNFDFLTPDEAARALMSMGLSSIPTWLRPFHTLSNGEQYRAALAMKVAKAKEGEIILVDEYTSVVDRDVAKAMSFALQNYIRKNNKKIVLASCHYDIMEWLMPDWTVAPQKGGVLQQHDYRLSGRPEIKLQISRVEYGAWDIFKKHHYLTENVNKSCKFLLFEWEGRPVAIVAAIPQPGAGDRRNAMAISRVVVLPDFQGLGLGSGIMKNAMALLTADDGGRKIYANTIHPKLGKHFGDNPQLYTPTSSNGKKGSPDKWGKRKIRVSYSYQYTGEPLEGFSDILKPVGEMRKLKKQREKNGA